MYTTPTIFITQLLAAMQVLMTLDTPLSTTMALPVTSKPIESTVQNLAWQEWQNLTPEQQQKAKRRKITPKSIFTLPNRIDCPDGHKQVDNKCIPLATGTNAGLVGLNYLTLIAGPSTAEQQYDYDDDIEDIMKDEFSYGPQMQIGEAEKSIDGLAVELRPPTKDEPLKFNIVFENKFNINEEEPMEDYSLSISNEGTAQSSEKESYSPVAQTTTNESLNSMVNVTAINDLVSEPSNISTSNIEVFEPSETISTPLDSDTAESNTLTSLADTTQFNIEAISLPASGLEIQKPHKISIFKKDSSIQLVTTVMQTAESAKEYEKQQQQQQENNIQALLQTDSLLPLINQATATTLLNTPLAESSSLTTASMDEQNESSSDSFTLNIEEDEMTTLTPNIMEQEIESKDKMEYTRSVTMNPLISDENASNINDDDGNETTLESLMNDEPLETTTTIQLDDTTIIENNIEISTPLSLSSPSSSPSPPDSPVSVDLSTQQELKELLIRQEQALKDVEELQRMRKGEKDQHTVLKKSKVQPVEVLSTATTSTTAMPATATKTMDELITAETVVTPLLTVHNENDNNNDRFYYQHIAKQDLEETPTSAATKQRTSAELTPATKITATATTTTTPTEIEAMPTTATSEIDPAEELRLINELVKGIQSPAMITTTSKTKTPLTPSATTEIITTLTDDGSSSSSTASSSESSMANTIKPTLSTSQIWSKILPLLTPPQESSTTASSSSSTNDIVKSSTESLLLDIPKSPNDIKTTSESSISSSNRSHRNSKIIRINGFNTISSSKIPVSSSSTTTTTEDPISSTSLTTTSTEVSSSTEANSFEPYWWLPVSWRLDKSVSTEKPEQEVKEEEQPLLIRFWSYHAPKSS